MTARENAEAAAEIFMRKRLILCSEPISGILTRDTIKLPGVAQVKNAKPKALKLDNVTFNCLKNGLTHRPKTAAKLLKHEIPNTPYCFAAFTGQLYHSKKSDVLGLLPAHKMDAYQIKKDSAVVVDFSVIIQRYAGVLEGKSATFLKLYEMIENHVRRLFRVYKFIRVDLVMDFYYSLSLKSSTRENRGLGKVANFVISDLLPANLQKDFLRNDNNKKQLNKMFKRRLLESDIPEGSNFNISSIR